MNQLNHPCLAGTWDGRLRCDNFVISSIDQHIFMNLSSVKMVEYVYHIESFG